MTTATYIINARPANAKFKAYTDGHIAYFANLADLRAWANRLNERYNLKGCELKIWKVESGSHSIAADKVVVFE